jgi:RHS repeat-associated protein
LNYDQLGSASLATDGAGNIVSQQDFDPWGTTRGSNTITAQTDVNYTGQIKDTGTGLIYYKARMYDPTLGRFLSADSIVPNDNSALRPLTVDFHEAGFVAALGNENRFTQQNGFTMASLSSLAAKLNSKLKTRWGQLIRKPSTAIAIRWIIP